MSKLLPLSLLLVAHAAHAGPCDQGFATKPGTVLELTRYNAGHAPMGKLVTTVVSSTADGDKVSAVWSLDNYLGATKASTTMADVTCDGKAVTIKVRNEDAMRYFLEAANRGPGNANKVVAATQVSEPQVYPLGLKVGDTLPPFRAFGMQVIQRGPPDWEDIMKKHDLTALLAWAVTSKFAAGIQMVTTNIKVIGQETCQLPGGATTPCVRISKEMYAKPFSGEADLKKDIQSMIKGAIGQVVTEWFAPGIGVVKMDITLNGRPLITMSPTALKQP